MSNVVIIGGHDCMACKYKDVCKEYQCRAKVFTQVPSNLDKKIGEPAMIVLFTNTVSHRMVNCAMEEAKRKNIQVIRSHTSSATALRKILEENKPCIV
ncbi:MAG: DUF2325 domain-containing protein [Peptococcaceae bacterium]|nr:DUF2325 domain-containing protein [Peptococcaceae bacterium]